MKIYAREKDSTDLTQYYFSDALFSVTKLAMVVAAGSFGMTEFPLINFQNSVLSLQPS